MNSTLLRIASVLLFIQASAHTFLGMLLHKSKGPAEDAVVEVMKAYRFNAMGSPRTFWDFYFGYGLISGVLVFLIATLVWQVGSLAKTEPLRARPLALSLGIGTLVFSILCWNYFFALPGLITLGAAICCCAVPFVTRRAESRS
ncbi:MAG TPA: hypothetical protein VKC60_17175 [Opitutaceae bacterium]|nr:hypothetical protein [Opitutaceae bacterium]